MKKQILISIIVTAAAVLLSFAGFSQKKYTVFKVAYGDYNERKKSYDEAKIENNRMDITISDDLIIVGDEAKSFYIIGDRFKDNSGNCKSYYLTDEKNRGLGGRICEESETMNSFMIVYPDAYYIVYYYYNSDRDVYTN